MNKSYRSSTDLSLDKLHHDLLEIKKRTSRPWNIETRLLHLGEEVGELFDIYLQYRGLKNRKQSLDDIENALNDVADELFALYDSFGIDIKSSLSKELSKK
jgi:NTP pyrophosphatase (non-canonical NTP hydrolase)